MLERLLKEVIRYRESQTAEIAMGKCVDYAEYLESCGKVYAFRIVEQLMEDEARKQHERGDS